MLGNPQAFRRTRCRCASFRITMWSRHSRRTLPRKRSQIAFRFGERGGILTTLMPDQVAAPSDSQPAIDEVFDITGDRTIPPGAPLADDDEDEDDDSESPTKFHS